MYTAWLHAMYNFLMHLHHLCIKKRRNGVTACGDRRRTNHVRLKGGAPGGGSIDCYSGGDDRDSRSLLFFSSQERERDILFNLHLTRDQRQ